MNFFSGIIHTHFFIRLKSWEYWPFGIIQAPLFLLWLWYSFKERSLLYFSASNPGILTGGMMGESKYEVLCSIPRELTPVSGLVKWPATKSQVLEKMNALHLRFPVILKPDLGERGWMVKRITREQDLDEYLRKIKCDFIVQELIDLPLEFGVYYIRFPSEAVGFVNSITGKEFLSVEGDGKRTLRQLILDEDRARLQWMTLKEVYAGQLHEVIPAGQKMEIVSIGNHCLGTKFLNGNHLITARLSASFDRISKQIPGFYFGRYDLRCRSLGDLENGNVKIMELNGCGAEPAHIYEPGSSLVKAVRVLIEHWNNLYRVSKENHARGIPYLSLKEGRLIYQKVKSLN